KYVLPGTYSITVIANGYQSQTINNVVVIVNSSTVIDFQLQQGGSHYVYRFSASQIPNNNYADEGLTCAAIGPPDSINYSIGKNGWCVLDMQLPITNGAGADFTVFEGDTSSEGYYCYAGQTIDGPWVSLGTGNGTTQFDLQTGGLAEAQFIKIVDDGDGIANQADAGFDLDAIEAYSVVPVELVSFTAEIPEQFALFQNYPNPFNPSTTIKFALPEKANVELAVYNSLGEKVADVFSGAMDEGYHEIEFRAESLSSGIYFYRLESQKFVSVKKMIILK
ncbi:MAG: T9SS type A sorting domain-containing protein, partial [Ignavibacteriaceae bacterium]|nr:T9SS type A sorting domain-containing protein [Ignavibacteriaceae bacterium]